MTLPSGHKVPADSLREFNFEERRKREKVMIDKLPTITGSIAGASSRFLKDYQSHRERELRRMDQMESEAERKKEREEFEHQRNERKRVFEEEAAKKRERRQRRKVGKSSEGLPLPVDVVQRIKQQEISDRKLVEVDNKASHPYSVGEKRMAVEPCAEKPKTQKSSGIRIIDEDG